MSSLIDTLSTAQIAALTSTAIAALQPRDWALLAVLGLGPLGASFFMWDKALKLGDARHIGILSYITPLASTALLVGGFVAIKYLP